MLRDVGYVLKKLDWMRTERIWPDGLRNPWTDAFGVVLYVSLFRELGESHWLDEADHLASSRFARLLAGEILTELPRLMANLR